MKPYVKNSLFEGVVGINEFKSLKDEGLIPLNTTVVSITCPTDPTLPKSYTNFGNIIEQQFWDTDEICEAYPTISDEQATELVLFILDTLGTKYMIHCTAGMSRSAAVAKFIEFVKIHNGDLYKFRTSPSTLDHYDRYFANDTVFRKLVSAFGKIKAAIRITNENAKEVYCLSLDNVAFKAVCYLVTHNTYVMVDGDSTITEWEHDEVFDSEYAALKFCIVNRGQVNTMINDSNLIAQIYEELNLR